jgi:uncharacterized ion transporter superfamily protein YfcC
MDVIFVTVFILLIIYFVSKRMKQVKHSHELALNKEVEEDFETLFEHNDSGDLTNQGMIELVEWYEEELTNRRIIQSREIIDFEELK